MITSIKKAQPISGHKGRDRWLGAVIAASGLSPVTVRLAVKLGIFFNCKTGQCNPGYARLAREIGVSRRSVIRAIAALEAGGWMLVVRSDGHHDHKSEFTLLMPGERVTTDVTPTGDNHMSPVQASGRVTESTGTGDKNSEERVTYAVTTKEPEEPEEPEERGSAARSADDDRESIKAKNDPAQPLRPVASAAVAAHLQPVREPELPPPCQAAPKNIGRVATANTVAATPFDGRFEAFQTLKRAYPQHRVGDEAEAYRAFCAAVSAAGRLSIVAKAITTLPLLIDREAEVPILAVALSNIAHDPPLDQSGVRDARKP